MQWYWVLIIVLVSQAAFLLVVWLLLRRQQPTGQELLDAERSKVKRLEQEAAAEAASKAKLAAEVKRAAEESRQILAWYNEQRAKISQEAQDAFNRLVTDPAELDRRLDALLGRADPTRP